MNISSQSYELIEFSIKGALKKYLTDEGQAVTDIHLQPNQQSGELIILNDEEEELAHVAITEWCDYKGSDFYLEVEHELHEVLVSLQKSGYIGRLKLMKPYSFVLIDEDKETVSELLLVDEDETMLLSGSLLKGLDEELDAFLKHLLES